MKLTKPLFALMLALSLFLSSSNATTYLIGTMLLADDNIDDDEKDIFIY
ncbi:MAG: hypothetical protein IJW63_10480 [Lachnospiraceae bacterium]|nr:hypothetical protein [Lachnospiraceae bacterium]